MKKIFILLCMVVSISLFGVLEIDPMGDDEYIDVVYKDAGIVSINFIQSGEYKNFII